MVWMYAIPQYNNLVFFGFFSVMSHKNITAEVHPTFIMYSQKIFWEFIIKIGCTSAVIFLWNVTGGKRRKTQLLYLGMAYIHTI